MKALSVRNPWAEFIETGRKTLELRTWRVNYRGPLLIVSGGRPAASAMKSFGLARKDPRFAYGQALCIVDLVDIRPATAADDSLACVLPGARDLAWVLVNPRPVDRFPVLGQLSIFDVEDARIALRP
jgi:hypothetical protein